MKSKMKTGDKYNSVSIGGKKFTYAQAHDKNYTKQLIEATKRQNSMSENNNNNSRVEVNRGNDIYDNSGNFLRRKQLQTRSVPTSIHSVSSNNYLPSRPQAPDFDISDMKNRLNHMYKSQKQAELERLQRARQDKLLSFNQNKGDVNLNYNNGIKDINNNIKATKQNYHGARNQTDASYFQNKNNLNEFMANNGLTRSGSNLTQQTSLSNQRQANLNNLNMQEGQTLDKFNNQANDLSAQRAKSLSDIDGQIDLLKRQGVSEENELIQRLNAQKNAALVDLMKYGDSRALQLYQIQNSNFDKDRAFNYQSGRDAINDARYDREYQDRRNDVAYNRHYQAGCDDINDQRYDQQYEDKRGDIQYNRDYQIGRDTINDNRYNQQYQDQQEWKQNEWDRQGQWHDQSQENWQKQFDKQDQWHKDEMNYKNRSLQQRLQASQNAAKGLSKTDAENVLVNTLDDMMKKNPREAMQWLTENQKDISNQINYKTYDLLLKRYNNYMNDRGNKQLEEIDRRHNNTMKKIYAP